MIEPFKEKQWYKCMVCGREFFHRWKERSAASVLLSCPGCEQMHIISAPPLPHAARIDGDDRP